MIALVPFFKPQNTMEILQISQCLYKGFISPRANHNSLIKSEFIAQSDQNTMSVVWWSSGEE